MMKTIKTILFIFLLFIAGANFANAGTGSGSVTVSVVINYTVTSTATSGGTITPASQVVASGAKAVFNVTPISTTDYTTTVTGCGGTLAPFNNPGTTYTTGAITSNCTVSAVFTKKATVPPSPTGLSATQSSCFWNRGQLVVSWNAVSGATSYTLKEGSTTLYTGSATSYTHKDLMPLSSHTYSVTASNAVGASSASTVTGKTLDVCPVAAPKNLTATPGACGTGTINLSWTEGSDYTVAYYLKQSEGSFKTGLSGGTCSDDTNCVNVSPHTKTTYSHTGLTPGSAHTYNISTYTWIAYPDVSYHALVSSPASIGTVYAPSACTFTVSATAGAGGKVSPASQTVTGGSKGTVTVTPNSGYAIDAVTGCVGNGSSLSGNTYTTAPVTANCTVSVTFKPTTTPTCSNGATNYPTCTTCASGSTMISGACTPVTVSVNASPTTYNTTPNGSVSFSYTPSTNSGSTECRLLDSTYLPLNSSYQSSSPIVRNAPSAVGSYGYYVQCRNTSVTSASANSNMITVNVATGCANGATNPPACNVFPPCINGATNPPTCNVFNPTGTLTGSNCSIASGNSSCTTTLTLSITNPVSGAQTNITKPTNVQVASGITPASKTGIVVNYPSTTFYLNHKAQTLANRTITASCVSGTIWGSSGKCEPVVCANGANNPPICNTFTPCANGATNPPTCTIFTPCVNGATNPPVCNVFPSASYISASNCEITEGNYSCPSSLSWNIVPAVGTFAVTTPPANTIVASTASGSTTYPVSLGSKEFYLYNSGDLKGQATATATCAPGTEWNGSACIAVRVDGGWDNGACGQCDISCNQQCTKLCTNPAPANGGANCPGDTTGSGVWNYSQSCAGGFCPGGPGLPGSGSGVLDINFSANPAKIFKGKSAVLSWTSDADNCIGNTNTSEVFDTGVGSPANGQVTVTPKVTTTYTLTCSGATSEEATQEVKVNSITVIER